MQTMSNDTDGEVSLAEAARQSGISERTLRRWVKAGKLACRKIASNYYLVRLVDLPTPSKPTIGELQRQLSEARAEIARLRGLQNMPLDALRRPTASVGGSLPVEVRPRPMPSVSHYSASGGISPAVALPGGLVSVYDMARQHGVSISTVEKVYARGVLPCTIGRWKVGTAIIKYALDPEQQAAFLERFGSHQSII